LYTGADGLPRSNIFLRDLTDRIQKEELRSGKEAAELASREKSAFLARMSHELRTPLNAILGFAQLLEFDPSVRTSTKTQAMIGHMRAAGLHLLSLIDEVLDLSRIEAGALSLALEPIEIEPLVRECLALTGPLAQEREIQLRCEPGERPHWILADRTRVRQVLVNVLANAIKYNRVGGSVAVRLSGSSTQVQIAIEDTGVGLSAQQIARLFQPFNRLGAESGGVEGTGLGLVIVKQLLEAMSASIQVDSEPGSGSTFTLRFARAAPAPAATSIASPERDRQAQ
jgi:signal transduction histidine kinase